MIIIIFAATTDTATTATASNSTRPTITTTITTTTTAVVAAAAAASTRPTTTTTVTPVYNHGYKETSGRPPFATCHLVDPFPTRRFAVTWPYSGHTWRQKNFVEYDMASG